MSAKKLMQSLEICQHTNQQIVDASSLPGGCPICLRTKLALAQKMLTSYDKLTTHLSNSLVRMHGLEGQTLTDAVAQLVARCRRAEADLKVATSPKAMESRSAKIEAELRKAEDWSQALLNDERVQSWVEGTDRELYLLIADPPVDFTVLGLSKPEVAS